MTTGHPEHRSPPDLIARTLTTYEEGRRAAHAALKLALKMLELPYAAQLFVRTGIPWRRELAAPGTKGCGRLILGGAGVEEFELDSPRLYGRGPYVVVPVVFRRGDDEPEGVAPEVGWVVVDGPPETGGGVTPLQG